MEGLAEGELSINFSAMRKHTHVYVFLVESVAEKRKIVIANLRALLDDYDNKEARNFIRILKDNTVADDNPLVRSILHALVRYNWSNSRQLHA